MEIRARPIMDPFKVSNRKFYIFEWKQLETRPEYIFNGEISTHHKILQIKMFYLKTK